MTELPRPQERGALDGQLDARDQAGRAHAVDPRFNVALEASAGTGKTRVLVQRYVNLLREGVDPSEVLALTFTRKAAAEMHDRVIAKLRDAAANGEILPARWRELRDRTAEVAISTIDAFCLALLREFPLEADLDPGFQLADDTEIPRLVDESLDRALRTCRAVARDDEQVALVFAQLGDRRARAGLAGLLGRRLVAPAALGRYVSKAPADQSTATVAVRGVRALAELFDAMRGGLDRFIETGPLHPTFELLARQLRQIIGQIRGDGQPDPAVFQAVLAKTREHFLTLDGAPRKRLPRSYPRAAFASPSDWRIHGRLVTDHAPAVAEVIAAYRQGLNALVARGVWRMYRIAEAEYRRTLDARAVLDFSDLLLKTLELLRQMEEFAQSRYRLESRYHHVLVDEFQDTSRAQWELVSLLIRAWGEGAGLAHTGALPPSIFIVGDRKQSIYAFRDADVALFREASRHIELLRPEGGVRHSISRSYRAVAPLLAFVNDVCEAMEKAPSRRDAFVYEEADRFPLEAAPEVPAGGELSLIAGATVHACALATAAEIHRLISDGTTVRDRDTGVHRPIRAGDIAILFRTRESHRDFEDALEARGIAAYVYKGLGFFDADEVKDVLALLWYLAEPTSDRRAAAWLRSRFVRLSDEGLRRLAPRVANALDPSSDRPQIDLEPEDVEALQLARQAASRWLALADRVPPAELLDRVLAESAYAAELGGPRRVQARENLKKLRATVRRIQNRGYATMARVAAHLDRLALGDEANAVIDATDAVSLMTVHASKGLEFPVVFVVNLSRGTGGARDPIHITVAADGDDVSVSIGEVQGAASDEDLAKDLEETKRLLYVALTRARDRLCLSSVVSEGWLQASRGSLAEVLPASLQALFAQAMSDVEFLEWTGPSTGSHLMRVVRPVEAEASAAPVPPVEFVPADAGHVQDEEPVRVAAVSLSQGGYAEQVSEEANGDSDRLVGSLVHRLMERAGLQPELDENRLIDIARSLVWAQSPLDVDDPEALADRAVSFYRALAARSDVQELYRGGDVLHEVPFTARVDGQFVRGTIDCLVRRSTDQLTVLEFKTGRPRSGHHGQLEVYRRAVQGLFPGASVDARLIYLGGAIEAP